MARKKKEHDFSVRAFDVVQKATNEPEPEKPSSAKSKNPHAVALGRLGGLKGGKVRASRMTPEQRKEIARKAARARWGK